MPGITHDPTVALASATATLVVDPFISLATPVAAFFPTVHVELGLEANMLDPIAGVVWTDVSNRCTGLRISRGRQHELARFEAGRATIRVDQSALRDLDPTNTASPYYPNIQPMRRLRVSASWDDQTYRLFTGYVTGWPQEFDPQSFRQTVAIEAIDALQVLNLARLRQGFSTTVPRVRHSPYVAEVLADSPILYWRLGDPVGQTTVKDWSGFGNNGTVTNTAILGQTGVLTSDQDTALDTTQGGYVAGNGSGGNIVGTGAFTWECWIRGTIVTSGDLQAFPTIMSQGRQVAGHGWASLALDAGYGTGIPGKLVLLTGPGSPGPIDLFAKSSQVVTDGKPHHIVAARNAQGKALIYIDGVISAFVNTTVTNSLDTLSNFHVGHFVGTQGHFSGIIDEVAVYNSLLTASRVLAHYNAGVKPWDADKTGARVSHVLDLTGYPNGAGDRSIAAGQSTLQYAALSATTTALGHLQEVADSEFGAIYVKGDGTLVFDDRYTNLAASSAATFGNGGAGSGEFPFANLGWSRDDIDIWNEVSLQRQNAAIAYIIADEASATKYGQRTFYRQVQYADDSQPIPIAAHYLTNYKDPTDRIRAIQFVGPSGFRAGDTQGPIWPQLLGRELNRDRITVKWRPTAGGSIFQQDCFIERIDHNYNPPGQWTTTWVVSPVPPWQGETYFTVGDAIGAASAPIGW